MNRLLAKSEPKVFLAQHIRDVQRAAWRLWRKLPPDLRRDMRPFWEALVVWHDLGKVQPLFQLRLSRGKGVPAGFLEVEGEIPHALFSVLWMKPELVKCLAQKLLPADPQKAEQLLYAVVAYHHWRDSVQEAIALPGQIQKFLQSLNQKTITDLENALQKELGNFSRFVVGWNKALYEGLVGGVAFYRYAPPPYLNEWLPQRSGFTDELGRKWVLLAGHLLRSDHFASAVEGGLGGRLRRPIGKPLKPQPVENFLQSKASDPWQLSAISGLRGKNVILVAPTGMGKTEFAFLWATPGRFFYTLPLRAAVHQTFERAVRFWRRRRVALLHGDASLYLAQKGADDLSAVESHELARHLAHSAVICTGDQLFPYAMRPPGYERIYFSLLTGALVIDEVQAYDPRAAALIVKLIEDISSLGGKFLLITATLPPFVKKAIRSASTDIEEPLNLYNTLPQAFCRHKVELVCYRVDTRAKSSGLEGNSKSATSQQRVSEGLPDEALERIKEVLGLPSEKSTSERKDKKSRKGSAASSEERTDPQWAYPPSPAGRKPRVLVVLNTVRQAQQVYNRLKELMKAHAEICLLHSLFTFQDRSKKERDLRSRWSINSAYPQDKPEILVATQVVEAALDIDADFLFTELAPMDALIQRMGRVARRFRPDSTDVGRPENPNIFIWVPTDSEEKAALSQVSGKGRVYEEELLRLTLGYLVELANSGGRLPASTLSSPERGDSPDVLAEEEGEPLPPSETEKKKSARKKSSEVEMGGSCAKSFCLLERDKNKVVEQVYERLPKEGTYLQSFCRMLAAVRAGLVAESREEAQDYFRHLAQVPVLSEGCLENWREAIRAFWGVPVGHRSQRQALLLRWKKDIEAKFFVQVPWYLLGESRRSLASLPEVSSLPPFLKKRLRGGYLLVGWEYDSGRGLYLKEEDGEAKNNKSLDEQIL